MVSGIADQPYLGETNASILILGLVDFPANVSRDAGCAAAQPPSTTIIQGKHCHSNNLNLTF
jgi:hypothetical protein